MVIPLLAAWVDSLMFLWSDTIKLTIYGFYKAIKESYWILITKFWWVFVAILIINRFFHDLSGYIGYKDFFAFVWVIVTVLAVRPSVGKKDYAYFLRFTYFGAIALFFAVLGTLVEPLLLKHILLTHIIGFFSLALGIYSPVYMSTAFFMSDSINSLTDMGLSIKHGLKMIMYNYPLFLIIHGMILLIWLFILVPFITFAAKPLTVVFGSLYLYYIRLLLLPVYACIINTIYIQRRR